MEKSSNGFSKLANKEQVQTPKKEEGEKPEQEKSKTSEATVSCEHQNVRDRQEESRAEAEENGTTHVCFSLQMDHFSIETTTSST